MLRRLPALLPSPFPLPGTGFLEPNDMVRLRRVEMEERRVVVVEVEVEVGVCVVETMGELVVFSIAWVQIFF